MRITSAVVDRWWYGYQRWVFGRSFLTILLVLVLTLLMSYQATELDLDASAESLIVEGDPDLAFYREVSERYGAQDALILTYTPQQPLFSDASLASLKALRDELRALQRVQSVISVIDVPLLANPPVPLTQLVSNIKTLESPDVDISLAESELANSPLYVNLLLNLKHNTTAIQINFPRDDVYENLLKARASVLRDSQRGDAAAAANVHLEHLNQLIKAQNEARSSAMRDDIQSIRSIIERYRGDAEIHLGGVPMIANDIMTYIRKDLLTFGISVLIFLVATLAFIFRHWRWIILPLLVVSTVVLWMVGILGAAHWQVTVISSNFVSLLMILTLSMTIHLIVRYRELLRRYPLWPQKRLVAASVSKVFVPCLYMALTTAIAFVSLVVSGIKPVVNFGWMMTLGIVVAFIITFVLFPAVLNIIGKNPSSGETEAEGGALTLRFAKLTHEHGHAIIIVSVLLALMTAWGISRLVVENSFIDYFGRNTEIYRGMTVIDQFLGGTTPLEILIDFDLPESSNSAEVDIGYASSSEQSPALLEFDSVGSFEDDFQEDNADKYWFTTDKIRTIKQIHHYLDALPQTGKVLSLATMIEIAEGFNNHEPLTNLQLALLYSVIPADFLDYVIRPYVSIEHNQARLNVRIIDSQDDLQRNELLLKIKQDLVNQYGLHPDQVRLSGMMVLYNNMLQSLYQSQISTLGMVFLGIFVMFLLLFRSLKLAMIAMAPNLLAALSVLGVMGWLAIPLDLMTITIASITIGIAVDNTIHYIVRFRSEFAKDGDYLSTMHRCHSTIGKAMFYTSITIIMGFSILILSNFKPTLYFGVLTALAMLVALVGALTLLPRLILLVKPFKTVNTLH